jgi:hypothetical protein
MANPALAMSAKLCYSLLILAGIAASTTHKTALLFRPYENRHPLKVTTATNRQHRGQVLSDVLFSSYDLAMFT